MVTDYDRVQILRGGRRTMVVATIACLIGVVTMLFGIDYVAFGLLVLLSVISLGCCLQYTADIRALELDMSEVGRRKRKG